jgi:hypothetical protein
MAMPTGEACSPAVARTLSAAIIFMALVASSACQTRQDLLTDQTKALTSLRATTTSIAEAWLSGDVSATYARVALESTQQLLETDRQALVTSSPDTLADPAARSLNNAQNQLTEVLAKLWAAVDRADAEAVRHELSALASRPPGAP